MSDNRYIRQTLLDEIGEKGQEKLSKAHIIIIGCGGLGSIAAPYLAGSGIGTLTLIDADKPNISNLHRQVFFNETQQDLSKSEALSAHIESLNPKIEVRAISSMLTKDNINELLTDADVVLECTDNIQAKYLVNDYCNIQNIPVVYGAIHKYDGYVSFFRNSKKNDIHLRDIFPIPNENIPSCSEVGVLGPLAGLTGLFQANEAIKFIAGAGSLLEGKLLTYDILNNKQMTLKLRKSFKKNMEEVYTTSTYHQDIVCDINEVSWTQYSKDPKKFKLISILDSTEHPEMLEQAVRKPLKDFDFTNTKFDQDQSYLFYCMSGQRSAHLISQLQDHKISGKFFNLKGGFKSTL